MGIWSTVSLTKSELIEEIGNRVRILPELSKERLAEILEAMVQVRDYDEYYDSEYGFNNFWVGDD